MGIFRLEYAIFAVPALAPPLPGMLSIKIFNRTPLSILPLMVKLNYLRFGGLDIAAYRIERLYFIFFTSSNRSRFCSSVSVTQLSNNSLCSSVN
jgi:hypothetical protein